jgi:hypothetical protein
MMEQKGDFRRHMELAMEDGKPSGDCLAEKDLMAHLRGEADAAARERMESHLVRCQRCRERFLELEDFFGPLRPGEVLPTEFGLARDWARLSQRIGAHGRSTGRIHSWPPRWVAVAASVLLTLGLVGGWSLRYLRDKSGFEASLGRAADENRRLQQRTEAMQQQLAELQRPQVNSPILDVYPTQALARSPGAPVSRVEIPANTPVSLILNGQGQRHYTGYSIAIIDRQGRELWHDDGLKRAADGNFGVILHGGFLPEGEYRFRIFGRTSSGREQIAEYVVSVRTPPPPVQNGR